jgi:hypothetical protein
MSVCPVCGGHVRDGENCPECGPIVKDDARETKKKSKPKGGDSGQHPGSKK